MTRARRSAFASIAAVALLAGCGVHPTFRKEGIADALHEILIADHFANSMVYLRDHTLVVYVSHPGTLAVADGQIGLGPAFEETARRVVTAIHRVTLSTDAPLTFYILLLADPATPGAHLTMVRHLDDIRRANVNSLDSDEIFARTIFELNYTLQPGPVPVDQYGDIRLEQFLTWQLVRRLQQTLTHAVKDAERITVGRCGGEYANGEFVFTLNVTRADEGPLEDTLTQQLVQTAAMEIAKVLSSYRFDAFNTVRLIVPSGGRNLVLPRESLTVFRQGRP
jgi:hypothetical protein